MSILIRLLGHDRYYRWAAWSETHMGAVLGIGALILLAICLPLIWLARPAPHSHDGFVTAEVLVADTTTSDETSFILRATLRLPDGKTTIVRTKSLALAQTIRDTACLERRRAEDGTTHYRLEEPSNCAE